MVAHVDGGVTTIGVGVEFDVAGQERVFVTHDARRAEVCDVRAVSVR
jgi:hypothetical protein